MVVVMCVACGRSSTEPADLVCKGWQYAPGWHAKTGGDGPIPNCARLAKKEEDEPEYAF